MPPIPLLFLDVDGPLIPFGERRAGEAGSDAHPMYPPVPPAAVSPLLARLDPAQGPRLAALPYELVWATTWGDDANTWVAARLGLPPLPVVPWPDDAPAPARGVHWKTPVLVAWAEGRPFAWVDDEIGPADRTWVAAHHPGPALLHRVDPGRGLMAEDFAGLTGWDGAREPSSGPQDQWPSW
ncbi:MULTISPECIES: hypothetical protein [unclassified Streptomyces]|uniref:hypothetical protein n=1 Tax=unclassified Streptomyces TaxID=2593676 RepID=UPI001660EBCB|nr:MULTISPECIES: hypothetical protein [unclassified Streptomyces]MBD0712434.1 hypothetical protein [Streptomyces sp. CBMA291]MBD0716808.1 hypothetical protein [Streptomyces sp. CBMA370]